MTHTTPRAGVQGLCAEEQLVLECSRVDVDADGRRRVGLLAREELDWRYVLDIALRHAVAPLLEYGLSTAVGYETADGVPNAVRAELRHVRDATGERSARLYQEVASIAQAFEASGIETIGLKDLTLAMDVYPDPSLRPIGDVDLLVRREEYEAAAQCLLQLDFEPVLEGGARYARKYAVGRHFRRKRGELWVDLQWNVAQREWDLYGDGAFTYDVEEMWRHASPIEGGGYGFLAPSTEDMLFHLCLHAEGHGFGELILLCDIAELLRCQGASLSWPGVLERARSHRVESSLYYTLVLCERLLGVAAPEDVLAELSPRYFQAAFFNPLFANVGPLHESLDHVYRAGDPPEPVMDTLEVAVRAHTVCAMRVASELDRLAATFKDSGGHLIVLRGQTPACLAPDKTLASLGETEVVVLDRDAELIRTALAMCGFVPGEDPQESTKQCRILARDPALADERLQLALRARLTTEPGVPRASGTPSKTSLARRAISAQLRPGSESDPAPEARIIVRVLGAEELLIWCAWVASTVGHERLLGLCTLLEPFDRLHASVDWERLERRTYELGVAREVSTSLQALAALRDAGSIGFALPGRGEASGHRLFEWARYGPDEMNRNGALRDPFFFLFGLLSTNGASEKTNMLMRSFAPRHGGPSLASLALQAVRGAVRGTAASRQGSLDSVYWLDEDTRFHLQARRRAAAAARQQK